MTDAVADTKYDIVRFDLALGDGWHQMPLTPDGGAQWADDLTASFGVDDVARDLLSYQLARVQRNLVETGELAMTAAVWVPKPESGYASCALGFKLAELRPGESLDTFAAELAADRERPDRDGDYLLEFDTWRGTIEAGAFIAARELVLHGDEGAQDGRVEERTVYGVFPAAARQMVQLVFSAESIGSFYDMSQQTQDIVSTLQVELEPVR